MTLSELLALDVGRLSPSENARYAIALEEAVRLSREESRRIWRCMHLAPDVETFEALVARRKVPLSRLDPEALRRTRRR